MITFDKPSIFQRILPIFRGYDIWLAGFTLYMALIGLLVMYSVGFDHGARFGAHGRNMLLAGAVMFFVGQIQPRQIMALAVPIYTVAFGLLIAVALFGITKKGSTRWINLGIIIQPSEIMKVAMPLMLAWWFQRREGQLRGLDFGVAALILTLPTALILKQPDLGTATLVLFSGLFVIFFAGLNWRLILPPVLLGVIGITILIIMEDKWCAANVDWRVLHDYQKMRICTLLDPHKDPLGKGFHIIQGMIAIGSGGMWGKGFMKGTQTHLEFIPERTTDFIFASLSEEFGLLGVLMLVIGFMLLVIRGLLIALEGQTLFARLLAAAMSLNIFVYAVVNMGMVSGMLPVVGVPLPFISYGGTAMVSMGVGLGILMSVARSKRLMLR